MDHTTPVPILALDLPRADDAERLLDRVGPDAAFVKVGLQLFVAEGPEVVRALRRRGCRIFLDLKLHDIPNTVAGAVRSAAALGVELLTVHASGGGAMLRAARDAAGDEGPKLLAVTVLTSLSDAELGEAWGGGERTAAAEVERLARLAAAAGLHGVVASARELAPVRSATGEALRVLTPGIRSAGDPVGDQTRTATPAEAVRLGADYLVLGRSVTAAADPRAAMERALAEISQAAAEVARGGAE